VVMKEGVSRQEGSSRGMAIGTRYEQIRDKGQCKGSGGSKRVI